MPTIEIEEEEFHRLLAEREHLRKQVADLQAAGTALVELRREGDISYCVGAFHSLFGFPQRQVPTTDIPQAEMKLRVKLENEEHFETIKGFYAGHEFVLNFLEAKEQEIIDMISEFDCIPDLVQIADGLCDSDFIHEGTRLYLGLPRIPILREVYQSNMKKVGGPFRGDGKILKPPGWRGPDIERVLREHGWNGK